MNDTYFYSGLKLLVSLIFLAVSFSCVKDDAAGPGVEKVKPGDRLPAFSVVMNDGSEVSDVGLYGKTSVIVFFHTQCPDCHVELPIVQKVYEYYAGNEDIIFVAISREEGAESILRYWNENGITLPFSAQKDRRVYELFSTMGIPRIYISDSRGVVHYVHSDYDMPSYELLINEIYSTLKIKGAI